MLFNSSEFSVFLLITLLVFYAVPSAFRAAILLAASLVFYAWSEIYYILLLVFAIVSTFIVAAAIEKKTEHVSRKYYLWIGLFVNIGILFIFKYLGFFTALVNSISDYLGGGNKSIPVISILLPVGISFFTFQSIGYLLDVYYKVRHAERNFLSYSLFVGFFPQLLSGPIGRSTELLDQLNRPLLFHSGNLIWGFQRFVWGLFKKVVIADRLDVAVDLVYGSPSAYPGGALVFATVLFAFQLYADFSGYTDMAIGVGRMFGIRLAENFNFPYISKNVTEFWRRWHLSLSNWLRDYLYIPALFSKKKWGKGAVVYALFVTFIICGLWHGASINFLLFGLFQGIILVYELYSKERRAAWAGIKIIRPYYNFFSWLVTFTFILLSFVFFRAESFTDAMEVIGNGFFKFYDLSSLSVFVEKMEGSRFIFTLFLLFIFIISERVIHEKILTEPPAGKNQVAFVSLFIGMILLFGVFSRIDFFYFKF